MASVSAARWARLPHASSHLVAAVAAAPVLLLFARLLPAHGPGLAVRLAAAALCLLVLPGALILRALAWPASPALAAAASFVVSLGVLFVALAATFAAGASPAVTIALVALAAAAAFVPALRARPPAVERAEAIAFAAVFGAAVVLGGIAWWVSTDVGTGDVLFHLARARKIAAAESLPSLDVVNEFRDGGLHPGYAFPLWHGALGLVAKLAGVDATLVALHLSTVLIPLAFFAAYAAGRSLFDHWAGGVAALAAQVAQLGFAHGGVGSFASVALPASVTRIVLVPTLLALAVAFVRDGTPRTLVPIAAAALAVAVVHPTYLIFAALVLAGFAVLWILFADDRRVQAQRTGLALAATTAPAALFFLWLLPVITSTAAHEPSAAEEGRSLSHYGAQLQVVGDGYRAAPEAITRAGPVVVAALLALPLLALWARRLWAAFAVGGFLLALALLLTPELFTRFSDLVSISQSRRLAQFLPAPFALAGAAAILGRLRVAGALLAFGCGLVLQLAYPGEFTHQVVRGGPSWALWVGVGGAVAGLVAAAVLRRRREPAPVSISSWTAAAALAFVVPLAVAGLADIERRPADPHALTPGLVGALRELGRDDVVFARPGTSHRIAAFAPVHVAATLPWHTADTEENQPYRRQRDAYRFFSSSAAVTDAERRRILSAYGATWIVVEKPRPYPRKLLAPLRPRYEDERYALYRLDDT